MLTLHRLLPVFPGFNLQAPNQVGFKVESAALLSTRIWQDFPLILISQTPISPGRGPSGGPPSRVDMEGVRKATFLADFCL